jgi:hypothetical protein
VKRLLALVTLLSLGATAPLPASADAPAAPAPALAKKVPMKKLCKRKPSRLTKKQRKACRKWRARHQAPTKPATGPGALTQPPTTPPVVAPPTDPTTPTMDPPTAPLGRLGVQAREFSLTVSRTQLAAGDALVELQNQGEDPHNLRIAPAGGGAPIAAFPDTDPLTRHQERVTFSPGTYVLFCSLPGHDAMRATISVQ